MCPSVAADMNIKDYWSTIFKQKNAVGNQMYPNLAKVVSVLCSFPFSNASVERVFSQLKLIKRDHRTALKYESLLSLITSKLWLQQRGSRVTATLDPPKEMLRLHSIMKTNADDEEAGKLRKKFLEEIHKEVSKD